MNLARSTGCKRDYCFLKTESDAEEEETPPSRCDHNPGGVRQFTVKCSIKITVKKHKRHAEKYLYPARPKKDPKTECGKRFGYQIMDLVTGKGFPQDGRPLNCTSVLTELGQG